MMKHENNINDNQFGAPSPDHHTYDENDLASCAPNCAGRHKRHRRDCTCRDIRCCPCPPNIPRPPIPPEPPVCVTPDPPVILVPASGETVSDGQPFILGTGTPGNTVNVCVDGVCTTTVVDENGDWSIQAPVALANGSHTITAMQTNECATSIADTVTFTVLINLEEPKVISLMRGQTFRTVDATILINALAEDITLHYLLLSPDLPAPTVGELLNYTDETTLINGRAARGEFVVPVSSANSTISRALPGREVPSPLPLETGVVDGYRYILYVVGTTASGQTTTLLYSPDSAIGMPFDSGNGTAADPFIVRELTLAELAMYPDLFTSHPISRAGVDETARELDNIEGMRVLHDINVHDGIAESLSLDYLMSSDFNLMNYQSAYNGDGWRPIGNIDSTHYALLLAQHLFTGTLSGAAGGSTITNLFLTPRFREGRWVQYVGFIGYGTSFTLQRISIEGVTISPVPAEGAATLYASTFCAFAQSSTFISLNAANQSVIFSDIIPSGILQRFGSIVGQLNDGSLSQITMVGLTLSSASQNNGRYGGIIGQEINETSLFTMDTISVSTMSVTTDSSVANIVGGIIAYIRCAGGCTLNNLNVDNVTANLNALFGGGLIGQVQNTGPLTVSNVIFSDINISANAEGFFTGGAIGFIFCISALTVFNVAAQNSVLAAVFGSGGVIGLLEMFAGANAEIHDVTVTNTNVTTNAYAGGLIGAMYREGITRFHVHDIAIVAGTINGSDNSAGLIGDLFHEGFPHISYIENITCSSQITSPANFSDIGGIVGFGSGVAFKNCVFSGVVSGTGLNVGGLAGNISSPYAVDCICSGTVAGGTETGGLIGSSNSSSPILDDNPPFPIKPNTIERCSMRGTFDFNVNSSNVGGIVGNARAIIISECFSLSPISSNTFTLTNTGGLVGNASVTSDGFLTTIANSYATQDISSNLTVAGGAVGLNTGFVDNCYFSASITGNNFIAGIVGSSSSTTGLMSNNFNIGSLVSASGANAARIANSGNLQNNHALDSIVLIENGVNVAAVSNPNGPDGESFSAADLETLMLAAGWSPSIWNFATIATLGRPTLIHNPE